MGGGGLSKAQWGWTLSGHYEVILKDSELKPWSENLDLSRAGGWLLKKCLCGHPKGAYCQISKVVIG